MNLSVFAWGNLTWADIDQLTKVWTNNFFVILLLNWKLSAPPFVIVPEYCNGFSEAQILNMNDSSGKTFLWILHNLIGPLRNGDTPLSILTVQLLNNLIGSLEVRHNVMWLDYSLVYSEWWHWDMAWLFNF